MRARHYSSYSWERNLDTIRDPFVRCLFWEYGSEQHHSEARSILGSMVLSATAPNNYFMLIRHLVLDGASQCQIGRTVTSRRKVLQLDDSGLVTTGSGGAPLRLPIVDRNHHLFPPLSLLVPSNPLQYLAITDPSAPPQWSTIRSDSGRAHTHVCGHSSFADIKTLLVRTQHWSDDASKYLSTVL